MKRVGRAFLLIKAQELTSGSSMEAGLGKAREGRVCRSTDLVAMVILSHGPPGHPDCSDKAANKLFSIPSPDGTL